MDHRIGARHQPLARAGILERALDPVDVGLVGLPNAGKSTLLNAVTNAEAKVGAYPFTTLRPQLGVVRHKGREFVMADIPGLIEGAAEGAGIGDRFLGHVERTRVLLHLVDAAGEDPAGSYATVRAEIDSYGAGLSDKPEVVALSRVDMAEPEQLKAAKKALKQAVPISAATGEGVEALLDRVIALLGPEAAKVEEGEAKAWSPL